MKFEYAVIGKRFNLKTPSGSIGPLTKASPVFAVDESGRSIYVEATQEIEPLHFNFGKEMNRREAWEHMAYEWSAATRGRDGKFYAMGRESLWKCISSLWMENRLSHKDKEQMQRELGKTSSCDEDLFGFDEDDAKNRVGFCIEKSIIEFKADEILECDGHGRHYWKCANGFRPAYGWVFQEGDKETCVWDMLCYNCGHVAMNYDFSPPLQRSGLLYKSKPVEEVKPKVEYPVLVSVYSSKTGLKNSVQGDGFVLK